MKYEEWIKNEIAFAKAAALEEGALKITVLKIQGDQSESISSGQFAEENGVDKNEVDREIKRLLDEVVETLYAQVEELALVYAKQDHSLVNEDLLLEKLTCLMQTKPLTGIGVNEAEWEAREIQNVIGEKIKFDQNRRDPNFVRFQDEDQFVYAYRRFIHVVNEEEARKSLGTNKKKINQFVRQVMDKQNYHDAQIKLPFTPRTFDYKWDFDSQTLIALDPDSIARESLS